MSKILLVIGVVVVLIIGFVAYQLYSVRKEGPFAAEAKTKVFSFIEYIAKNDVEAAYKLTSTGFKAEVDKQKFTDFVTKLRADGLANLEAQREIGFSIQHNAGKPTIYSYKSEVKTTDGKIGQVTTSLVQEDGELKIYNFVLNPKTQSKQVIRS